MKSISMYNALFKKKHPFISRLFFLDLQAIEVIFFEL